MRNWEILIPNNPQFLNPLIPQFFPLASCVARSSFLRILPTPLLGKELIDSTIRGSSNMAEPFIIQVSEAEVKKEREKARLLRRTQWWKQRLARGICYYCQHRFLPSELTMEHIVPLIRGGRTTKGNVVAVCKECNKKKKYLLPMEWEEYLKDSLRKK